MQIPEQTAALSRDEKILAALEQSLRWHHGDKFRDSSDEPERAAWEDHKHVLDDAIGQARTVAALATTKATAPVARGDAVNLARNVLETLGGGDGVTVTERGTRLLAEAVMAMDAALSAAPVEAMGEPVAMDLAHAVVRLWDVHGYAAKNDLSLALNRLSHALNSGATPATSSSQDAPRAVPAGLSDAQRKDLLMAALYLSADEGDAVLTSTDATRVVQTLFDVGGLDALVAASAPGAKGEK